jgi:uncharacterized protein (DUF697 family)
MSKSKTHMPKEIHNKCAATIHITSITAGAAGGIPIPMSDTVPITAAQIAMIVKLGKVFDLTISNAIAKSIINITLTQQLGRAVATNILKCIPVGGQIAGAVTGASVAATFTETLGWIVADDFYRLSIGEDAENIGEAASEVKGLFEGTKFKK